VASAAQKPQMAAPHDAVLIKDKFEEKQCLTLSGYEFIAI
jgi:hypothetical protein